MNLVIKQYKSKKNPSKPVYVVYQIVEKEGKKEWNELGFANIVPSKK